MCAKVNDNLIVCGKTDSRVQFFAPVGWVLTQQSATDARVVNGEPSVTAEGDNGKLTMSAVRSVQFFAPDKINNNCITNKHERKVLL